jgi:hypothetical protein
VFVGSDRLLLSTLSAHLSFGTVGLLEPLPQTALIEQEAEMSQRTTFADMKAEQKRVTASWKAEGRLSEPWTITDPEIVEIFNAGIAFGVETGRRTDRDPLYTQDEWRKALREAVEKAATLENSLQTAQKAMQKK